MNKEILQTNRLIIRAWTLDDAEALFEICRDPEVMLHIGTGKPYQSINDARRFLRWAASYQEENGFCRWAVVERASQKIIGSCGFVRLERSGEIELGYLFARRVWGKGYATEAASACIRHGFERLRFAEVIALTDTGHDASQRVLEKIGFTYRGVENYDGQSDAVYVAVNPGDEARAIA
ncbi:MAG TPA: GNAT family N-acetyltransferase [Pyrinomonadaceae bacterium]|nr:GNAT family N-acetyltransferase [Pyrinomonadaceae bacterium]